MRVLNMTVSLEVGGTERYLVRVAPLLAQYGIDVELYLLKRGGPLVAEAEAAGIPVLGTTDISRRVQRSRAYALMGTVPEIAKMIRLRRYDIVHTYLFYADVFGTAAARLAGSPRVIISRRALYPWRRPLGAHYYLAEATANLLANELIANSQTVLRDAERTERFLPTRRTVIYNGVDVTKYDLARPKADGVLKLVTIGVLEDRKGHEYALKAVQIMQAAGIDAELTIVGGGSKEASLRHAATELAITNRVVFAGSHADPRPYLTAADIFVMPSRQEGFSNAVLEAMASGLPVVATDVGGNAEAVVHREGGLIVPADDATALAKAIIELHGHRRELGRMGQANRLRVDERFSLATSVRRLASWYLERDLEESETNA